MLAPDGRGVQGSAEQRSCRTTGARDSAAFRVLAPVRDRSRAVLVGRWALPVDAILAIARAHGAHDVRVFGSRARDDARPSRWRHELTEACGGGARSAPCRAATEKMLERRREADWNRSQKENGGFTLPDGGIRKTPD
jgi:hypothetical protein